MHFAGWAPTRSPPREPFRARAANDLCPGTRRWNRSRHSKRDRVAGAGSRPRRTACRRRARGAAGRALPDLRPPDLWARASPLRRSRARRGARPRDVPAALALVRPLRAGARNGAHVRLHACAACGCGPAAAEVVPLGACDRGRASGRACRRRAFRRARSGARRARRARRACRPSIARCSSCTIAAT